MENIVPLIEKYEQNILGKDYAVGDIHGCFTKLWACLDRFFDPSKDRLFAVGDLVDRGPDSAEAEKWLGLPWFFSARGNHDDGAARWPNGHMDLEAYQWGGGHWNVVRSLDEQLVTARAMEALPLAIEVETASGLVGIVHAECPFESWAEFRGALESFASLNRTQREELERVAMRRRVRYESKDETPVRDVRAVICGHSTVSPATRLGNVFYIDTGACYGDDFTFIDLATLTTFHAHEIAQRPLELT